MEPMPPKYYRHLKDAPAFVRAVDERQQKSSRRPLVTTLDAFEDDPFLLYTCLWYAVSKGVSVTVRAPRSAPPGPAGQ